MLNKLKRLWKRFFPSPPADPNRPQIGDVVGNIVIASEAQRIKHTKFEAGESYVLGEAIVTVHATKESMLAAIAATDARREAKHKKLHERAIDIMLMAPSEIEKLNIGEWIETHNKKATSLQRMIGKVTSSPYLPRWLNRLPSEATGTPPSGLHTDIVADKFKEITKEAATIETPKVVDKVKV